MRADEPLLNEELGMRNEEWIVCWVGGLNEE